MPDAPTGANSSPNGQDERRALLSSSHQPGVYRSSGEITAKFERKLLKATTYAEMEIIELQSKIEHRELWSKVLLSLVALIIVSDMAIIFFTGFGLMKFDNETTLPLFIASNLAQIFTLSVLVVKFLFRQDNETTGKK